MSHQNQFFPRSSVLLFLLLSFLLMVTTRVYYKIKREIYSDMGKSSGDDSKGGVIYIGSIEKLESWIRGLNIYEGKVAYRVVAAIASNNKHINSEFYVRGVPVSGDVSHMDAIVEKFVKSSNIKGLLVESGFSDDQVALLSEAAKVASRFGLKLYRVPTPQEVQSGEISAQSVKPVNIGDLLGRKQKTFSHEKVSAVLNHKTVLVTGGGGSIGSELVRQISAFNIKKLILVENSEFNLYQIENWIKMNKPNIDLVSCYSDIRDREKLKNIFSEYKPNIVYHAAALKHVPLMEKNRLECVKTNIFGTKNLIDLSVENGIEKFTLVSTDKAVTPENTMGFTKRIAEIYCQSKKFRESSTNVNIVRFGNVLGSSGSVIPLFEQQIKAGGPLTVTHPEATRFFMTIPEAAQLVIQTGFLTKKMPTDIFILEMGEPLKILTLAEKMIRLSGAIPYEDIDVKIIGLRPGEKIHEELYLEESSIEKTEIPGVLYTDALGDADDKMGALLEDTHQKLCTLTAQQILLSLEEFVPEHKIDFSKFR